MSANDPRWDGPGNLYYVLALVAIGVLASCLSRRRGMLLIGGLLAGVAILLAARSAPVGVVFARSSMALLITVGAWWATTASRRVLVPDRAP